MKPWPPLLAIGLLTMTAPVALARPEAPSIANPASGAPVRLGEVSIEANGASLKEVLIYIARKGHIGLIMASDVPDRKIDIILHDVPAPEALEAAAMAGGLVWHSFGTTFVVWAPKPPLLSPNATP